MPIVSLNGYSTLPFAVGLSLFLMTKNLSYKLYRFLAFYAVAVPSVISILFNKRKEPFFSYKCIFLYLLKRDFFPFYNQINYRRKLKYHADKEFPFLVYNNDKYFYPGSWSKERIIDSLNGVLNEQNMGSPHRYLTPDEIKEGWIIYDVGAAEGLQAKQWLKNAKKIIIFEPDQKQCECLRKTFEEEIKKDKIKIVPEGVSDKYHELKYGNTTIVVDSLPNLIKKYDLPKPHYIKADIEGEEMHMLKGAENVFRDGHLEAAQITTYHRHDDGKNISEFFSQFPGKGEFSEGFSMVNRDGLATVIFTFYHPIIRKCLYTYRFT